MIPSWKKWLSYLTEVHIESAQSETNPHLYVCMSKGKLQLCSENTIYSYDENYHNFAGSFAKMDLTKIVDQDILVLGFGLGSIPLILQNTYGIKANYTGIELDENVLHLFETYNAGKINASLQLICADAKIFATTCQEKYRLICSDIFLDNITPAAFWEEDYLHQLSEMLDSEGALLFNTLALTDQNKEEANAFFEEKFIKVFPNAIKLEVHLNYMLLSDKKWLQ